MSSASLAGTAFGLTSAFAWSLANVAIQKSTRRFGPLGALFGAQIAGGLVALLAGLIVHGIPGAPHGSALGAIVIAGIAAAIAYGGLFTALEGGAAAVCAPIISAWSIVSVAIDVCRRGDLPGPVAAAGIIAVVFGNALLARFGTHGEGAGQAAAPRKAVIAAFASAIGFGLMVPATAEVGAWCGPIHAVPLVWCAQWLIGLPAAQILKMRLFRAAPRTPNDLLIVAAPGAFEAIGFLALTIGMTTAPIRILAPASSLSTAFTVFLGVFWLKERLARPALFGAVLAAGGVVLVNL